MTTAILVFLGSLALSVIASIVLGRRLEQLGAWLGLGGSLLGIITALGADSPEISSAITALRGGHHDLGLGIALGSNVFNLAALMGLSALVSGKVHLTRRSLVLNGGVAVCAMAVVTLQLFGLIGGWWAIALIAVVMAPYIAIAAVSPAWIWRCASCLGIGAGAVKTAQDVNRDANRAQPPPQPSHADLLGSIPALVSIVIASIGMVHAAVVLGGAWKIPEAIIGTIVLATLTGIPNVVTALQLAGHGRGSAVLSESLNSNTLNLIAGVSIPIVILGMHRLSGLALISLWWMIAMTLVALGLAFSRRGLGRAGGGALVAAYLGFIVMVIAHG